MPVLPPAPKCLRVDLFQSQPGNTRVRDRFFLQYTGANPSAADLTTLANTIVTSWNTNMRTFFNTGHSLTGVEVTDLNSNLGAQVVVSAAVAGTRAGVGLEGAQAAIVKFRVTRRYRGGHARIYLCAGVNADMASSTSWVAAFPGNLSTAWAAFMTANTTAPPASLAALTHVNVSYFSGFSNHTYPSGRIKPVATLRVTPTIDAVISYSVNPNFGSQRRRNLQSV